MATQGEATLILKIKQIGKKVLDKFVITLGDIVNIAGSVTNGLKRIGQAFADMALQADEFNTVAEAFKNLASSQGEDADKMLANMERLSAGTISRLELMKQANNALLLGLPVDRFGDMLEIARASAKATGQSMQFMLQSITTGLGRGSKLILDNLGIIVNTNAAYRKFAEANNILAKEMTEAQKKQAFINEALRIGKENSDKMTAGGLTLNEMWQKFKARVENLTAELGQNFIPVARKTLVVMNSILGAFIRFAQKDTFANQTQRIKELKDEMVELRKTAKNNNGTFGILAKARLRENEDEIKAIERKLGRFDDEEAAKKEALTAQKQRNTELQEEEKRAADAKEVQVKIDNEKKLENQRLLNEALKEEDNQALIEEQERKIGSATNIADAKKAIDDKSLLQEKLRTQQRQKEQSASFKFEQALNSQKVKLTQKTLGTIATLTTSNSRTLQAIGRAAATASIIVNTARGVMETFKLGIPLGPILAPLVVAAGAAQIAKVNSAPKLADGGIVSARPGGTQAIIGEGGQDEAVIPLDDDDVSGRLSPTIIVNAGAFIGDQGAAREFAVMVDQALFELRQGNESVAFERDIV